MAKDKAAPPNERPKMSLFLDHAVHQKAKKAAAEAGLSLTKYVEQLVVDHFRQKRAA